VTQLQRAPEGQAKPAEAQRPRPVDPTVYKVPIEGSPALGKATARVTMVEISDYQCPFCSRGNTTVEQLENDYGDKLRVVMKQNPLPFHEHAKSSALAALAAGEQG
jgi:protein-disulfide isomerase